MHGGVIPKKALLNPSIHTHICGTAALSWPPPLTEPSSNDKDPQMALLEGNRSYRVSLQTSGREGDPLLSSTLYCCRVFLAVTSA